MRIVVETPKWSFRKIVCEGGEYKPVFISPIPTPFNYGLIEGSKGDDGMPLDVIIMGPRLDTGTAVDEAVIGRVGFIDDGRRDDKYIVSLDGKRHSTQIQLFFTFYSFAKLFIGLANHRRLTQNRYTGMEWFEEELTDPETLPP